jgi:hypothetical protein
VAPNDGSLIWCLLLVVNRLLDVIIELFFGADFMNVLDDLIRLDVELGHVEGDLFLLAEKAQL